MTVSPTPPLPIHAVRDEIVTTLLAQGRLILSAPPGTGKSTQVPQFFLDAAGRSRTGGKILVLQPRRIAARNLALRVASERQEAVGTTIGYQVRFDSKVRADTAVIYQTYGIFFQTLVRRPKADDVGLVILDEFHERTLETDAVLAWLWHLQRYHRPELKLIVMSATLEGAPLAAYLAAAPVIDVPVRHYPVTVSHQAPLQQEHVAQQSLRALKQLATTGIDGSILMFMPGVGEIRRTAETIGAFCRQLGLPVHELHGSMDVSAQQRVLGAPATAACVIVSTNIAETSLTIPGVTTVIDSGQVRQAAYHPDKDMNTLHLGMISRHSAVQRTGRAGRTGPGRCVRLWGAGAEASMAEAMPPEVLRLEMTGTVLALHALQGQAPLPAETAAAGVPWLTPPEPDRWAKAVASLYQMGALAAGRVTPLGRDLLRYPVHPALARVLVSAKSAGVAAISCAMVAVLEGDSRSVRGEVADLFALGLELVRDPQAAWWERDIREAFRQLTQLVKADEGAVPVDTGVWRQAVTACWLAAFGDRVAVRIEGTNSFVLADGRKGTLDARSGAEAGNAILAMELHETGGANQSRQVAIPLFLPCASALIQARWPGECEWVPVSGWDALRRRVVQEEQLVWRGLVLDRRPSAAPLHPRQAGYLLVDKLMAGDVTLGSLTDEVWQWVYRVQLAARHCPEYGFPGLDADDWRLIYHDLCAGKTSLAEVEATPVLRVLRDYVGALQADFLDRLAPRTYQLPGNRPAKITYSETEMPEMAARLGDFLGMEGPFAIMEGRVPVRYDILAPNYRTVQKTMDLTSFWQNTYPEVKKELKRRYPKHPWP
ncbi:MAG: DEAD/DEAH box helicase [Candidatus Sericytochromatia bacterium]|nr:DEAD/DEAH box helicase [Candidatus Sericytochromatia bacterium]